MKSYISNFPKQHSSNFQYKFAQNYYSKSVATAAESAYQQRKQYFLKILVQIFLRKFILLVERFYFS